MRMGAGFWIPKIRRRCSGGVISAAGSPGYAYRADLDRDGGIDAADLALVHACVRAFDPSWHQLYLPLLSRSSR